MEVRSRDPGAPNTIIIVDQCFVMDPHNARNLSGLLFHPHRLQVAKSPQVCCTSLKWFACTLVQGLALIMLNHRTPSAISATMTVEQMVEQDPL